MNGDVEIVKWVARRYFSVSADSKQLIAIDADGNEYHPVQHISGAIDLALVRPEMQLGCRCGARYAPGTHRTDQCGNCFNLVDGEWVLQEKKSAEAV